MVVCGMLETSFHTRKYNPQFNLQNKTESNEFSLPPFVDTPNKLVSLHYNKLTPQLQFENLRGGGGRAWHLELNHIHSIYLLHKVLITIASYGCPVVK